MHFVFSAEQDEFRAVVRRFLAAKSPEPDVRRLMVDERGYDDAVWKQMAEQLGLTGLIVPEVFGGSGCGPVELAIVLEEMGRSLLPAPYFATTVLATQALLLSEDEAACAEFLPAIAEGATIATVAIAEQDGCWDLDAMSTVATPDGEGYRLDGCKSFVVDGHVADLVLVAACDDGDVSLFAVTGGPSGVKRELLNTMDGTRKQARLTFDHAPARLVGQAGGARRIIGRLADLASIALAAEAVGGAQRCLDMAVDYAKVRVQFGRPIGSFQAIKHRCADMLLEVESARAAAYYAAFSAADDSDDIALLAPLALAYCADAFFSNAAGNIQIHGGIGFTWEHPAHLYYRRAKSSQVLFGTPNHHRELLAQRLGI